MMSFKKIVESLQQEEENQNFLILIRCGVFFVGIGKDAVILAERLGITNICFTEGVCKCGIPVNRMDKMLRKIIEKDISVAIYEYNPKGIEKELRYKIKVGELDSKEAKKYLCGHFGYIKYANVKNLTEKLFEV